MNEHRIAELAAECADSSRHFREGLATDGQSCLELFRLALADGNSEAWQVVTSQYRGLVHDWIWRYPAAQALGDHDDLAMRAFERFWRALSSKSFDEFPTLQAVLAYLKRCAVAVVLDEARRNQRLPRLVDLDHADEAEAPRVEREVEGRLDAAQIWSAVEQALDNTDQKLVIYLTYAVGLRPREIARRHSGRFGDVQTVYRLKRLALERLRREPGLAQYWNDVTP